MAKNIGDATDSNFGTEVLQSNVPVLVDFWAEWCGPCRALTPIVEELANDYNGKIKVLKMNVDENPEVPGKFGIRGIPTLILFKDGDAVDQIVGALPKANIAQMIQKHI